MRYTLELLRSVLRERWEILLPTYQLEQDAALRVSRGVTARRPIVLSAEGDDEVYDDAPVVSYLTSEATTAPDVPEKKGWELADEYRAGTSQPAVNAGPTNYDGFVDSEGFDGGDGQVGVVGDGETSNLENFDNSQAVSTGAARSNAIGGKDSKSAKTKVAFGYSSGYADQLEEQGMVEIDNTGEDRLSTRRQQFENWRNQQEVKKQQDAVSKYQTEMAGGEFNRGTHQAAHYLEQNTAAAAPVGRYTGPSGFADGVIGAENVGLEHGDEFRAGDVLEEIRFRALAGGRGVAVVSCSNTAMTYDDFAAGFAPGALAAFKVEPSSGVLNGARGEPTEFKVTVDGSSLAGGQEYEALLVVDTEEDKFTYKLVAEVS